MFVGLMSSQIMRIGSLILTEIASVYHFVADGRTVWRKLVENIFQLHLYTQWLRPPASQPVRGLTFQEHSKQAIWRI